jgi:hypothetical protein
MRNKSARLLTSLSFFGMLAASAWAGGIKHPSSYGVSPLNPCGAPYPFDSGLVTVSCFQGGGGFEDDLLVNFTLISPATALTSATFNFSALPTDFGLVEGTSGDACAGDLVDLPCGPDTDLVTIADSSPLALTNNVFTFSNSTGDQSVTAYFTFSQLATGVTATLTADNTSGSTTSTPEPSEIGLLMAAFACVVAVRRMQLARQNS